MVFITHDIDEAIFLGDRVLAMTARPGRFCAEHRVPFPRPRDHQLRGSPEFAALRQEIWSVIRSEVDRHMMQASGQTESSETSEVLDAVGP